MADTIEEPATGGGSRVPEQEIVELGGTDNCPISTIPSPSATYTIDRWLVVAEWRS